MARMVKTVQAARTVTSAERGARAAFIGLLLVAVTATAQESAANSGFIIKDSSTDRTPAKTAIPSYPRIARRDRIEGDATVCFRIDLNGRIRSARVEHYTDRIFRRPALRAIRASSFEALRPDEILNTERVCRTFRFRLEPVLAEKSDDSA